MKNNTPIVVILGITTILLVIFTGTMLRNEIQQMPELQGNQATTTVDLTELNQFMAITKSTTTPQLVTAINTNSQSITEIIEYVNKLMAELEAYKANLQTNEE